MCVIMLAHNGLALITEKLQKQKLEEFPPSISGNHVSQVNTSLTGATSQQQTPLSVKGKHVWTLSLETERLRSHELGTQDTIKSSPQSTGKPQLPYLTFCRHEQLQHASGYCHNTSGAPAAPPKKKRCRSLSGPPECLTTVSAPVVEYSGKVWKPIAVIPPQSSSNVVTTRTCESSSWLPHKTTSFKLLPAISSHRSTDCGCYTNVIQTSSHICYTNSNQSSSSGCCTNSANTSSGSPIPRPASAASDTSFSSIWQDSPKENRVRILENRSLSCEDQISGSSSINPAPCGVQDKSNICNNIALPRCHSQPCILHHRRYGKKRRRDFQRPALNFHKMTETAYIHAHVPMQAESWEISSTIQQVCGSISQVFADGCADAIFDQNSNDSSPLNFEFLPMPRQFNPDVRNPASIALPVTPPMYASTNTIRSLRTRDRDEDNQQYRPRVEDEDKCVYQSDFNYHSSRTNVGTELFSMIDLDILEIESH